MLALPICILFWPASLGGDVSFVFVKGTSMQPTLYEGDLAVVRAQSSYDAGDIVTFRVPEGDAGEGAIVIHRIVGRDPDGTYTVQGDNKESPDRWHPGQSDVVGRAWFHIDGVGAWFAKLFEPLGRAAIVGILALFLLVGNGRSNEAKRLLRRRRIRSRLA